MSKEKPKSAMASLLEIDVDDIVVTEASPTKPSSEMTNTSGKRKDDLYTDLYIGSDPNDNEKSINNRVLKVDPNECRLWQFSDRPYDELGDIKALAESLKTHGQQEPILVRKNTQNTAHKYEVIFGNRRWRAAQIAKVKLDAICKKLTDQQAALCQKEENENRIELSDYARANSYRAQIDGGIFRSEIELSRSLGISKQALNDLMAYLRVPKKLREAINNYKTLSKKMVIKLASLSKNTDILDVLIHLAPKISDNTITTSNLDKYIHKYLAPVIEKSDTSGLLFEKRDKSGRLIYRTRSQSNGDVSLVLKRQTFQGKSLEVFHERFKKFLEKFLEEE